MCFVRARRSAAAPRAALVLLLLAIASLAPRAAAQDFPTIFRRDEVGKREFDFNDETFLNLISFGQPLESLQPFYAADSGWYTALGSLSDDLLWFQQDVKLRAPISDVLTGQIHMRNSIDFDTEFSQVLLLPELALSDHFYAGIPVVLSFDKGGMDYGLEVTWRDPARSLDYLRLSWVRSDLIFNEQSDDFPDSEYERPADNYELQLQADLFGCGPTTLVLAEQVPSRLDLAEEQHVDRFTRFHARLLQAIEWTPTQRFFFEGAYEIASESSTSTGPLGVDDDFEGDRDFFSGRLEYQHDLDEERSRRVRVGSQYVYFREDAAGDAAPVFDTVELRREAIVYLGYRTPIFDWKDFDLETVVWLDRLWNVTRSRINPRDDSHAHPFQGKISFYLRWHLAQRAEFVLSPSFELDQWGWAGGSVMLRYRL